MAKSAFTLSGSLNYDADVRADSVRVMVSVNGVEHQALVQDKTWSLTLTGAQATAQQGENTVTVNVSVYDQAGNQGTVSETAHFQIDMITPKVNIELNQITVDNQLTQQELNGEITLSGSVSGEFKEHDTVHLLADGQALGTAQVDANGAFHLTVQGAKLNQVQHVTASMEMVDLAGNIGSANTSQTLTMVATPSETPQPLTLHLDTITSDNLLNVSEAKSPMTTLSGSLNGTGAAGKTVTIQVGNETLTAKVGDDLHFKTEIAE